jgi:hypothetical protein
MKTITFTAVMAVLVVVPFILKKKRPQLIPFELQIESDKMTDESLRYAIDDFIT